MTGTGVSQKGSLNESLASPKSVMKIGTWNVRTMYRIGKTTVVAREMRKYEIDVLGISECRWAGFGQMRVQARETLLYSGRDDDAHLSGVAMLLSRKATSCLISWSPVNDRIITARFNRTSIVQVYAPTNDAEEEAKDVFYEQVQNILDKIPKHNLVILMGDWNAKIGDQQDGEGGVVGCHGLHGERSENGECFVQLCTSNNVVITTTLLPHKDIHKYTWVSPDARTKNQIDNVAVCGKFKRSVLDTRTFRGANVNSDHYLVITKIKLRLCRVEKKTNRLKKYNTAKLKVPEVVQNFKIILWNRFSCLADDEAHNSDDHAQDVENDWKKIKQTYQLKRFWGFSQGQTDHGSVLNAGRK